jgi:exodeoxyribonuclease V alpha subunit
MKIYRGAAAAARHYVEADRSRADDYYLAEGSGVAMRMVADLDKLAQRVILERRADLDGDTYEQWVAGYDVETGAAKGRLRTDDQAVRFVEVTVNGPKTWSLAAALHPEIAEAYDAAQQRAAEEIISWLAKSSTTRVGPRGRQVQVPVEQIEAAVVRHFTSRAGDPHRHLHLQINARVWAAGGWRGIHTVGVRDSLEAINGIGHAAVMTDPEFRDALAAHGYTLDPETGEVTQLVGYAGAFSSRSRQIEANIDRYEAQWRHDHPDEEPGPALRQAWDRRAWADARPDKVVPVSGAELRDRWIEELIELGFRVPAPRRTAPKTVPIGSLDRDALAARALDRLAVHHSAWNAADVRGEVEKLIASSGVVARGAVRRELAEDLTARALAASLPLLTREDVPEHVRALSSPQVLAVEHDLVAQIIRSSQREKITIVEGAAGAGKTRRLAATRQQVEARGGRMLVVTPTRKAAQVAAGEVGTKARAVAKLLHDHGFRWDDDGRWSHTEASPTAPPLDSRTLLVVDEAGMLDQDSARQRQSGQPHRRLPRLAHRIGEVELTPQVDQESAVDPANHLVRQAATDELFVRTPPFVSVAHVPLGLLGVVDQIGHLDSRKARRRLHGPQHAGHPELHDPARMVLHPVDPGSQRQLVVHCGQDAGRDLQRWRLQPAFVRRERRLRRARQGRQPCLRKTPCSPRSLQQE